MDSNNKNEMEEIQRGLEAFLEKELDGAGKPAGNRRNKGAARSEAEPEEIQIIGQPREQYRRGWEADGEEAYRRGGQRESDEEAYRRGRQRRADEEPYRRDWQRGFDEDPYQEDWQIEDDEEAYQESWQEDDEETYQENWDMEVRPSRRRKPEYEDMPVRRRRQYEDEPAPRGRSEYETGASRRRRPEYEDEVQARKKRNPQKAGQSQEEEDSRMSKKAQKKRRKKKSRLKKILIAAAVIFILLGVGLYQLVGVVYGKMTYKEIESVASSPMKEDGVVNILLIGNDSRENGEDGRSDAMILLSISNKTKTIYMTSLLRDMYVDIPGHDGNRLNAAYSFGGAELLMETIELNFDIPVNRYMLVNFEAFANLVDAVNGIDLELSKGEIEYVNGYLWEYNMLMGREDGTDNMDPSVADNGPAVVHLNGPQALAYSRNRYIGTDFGRTERQRKILTAVIHKLPSAMLTNAGGLVDGLMPNLTTNLTQNECFRLSLMGGKLLTYDIVSDSVPQPDTYQNATIRSMAVLEVDFDANIRYLKEKIYGE